MKCKKCGANILKDDIFCSGCLTPIQVLKDQNLILLEDNTIARQYPSAPNNGNVDKINDDGLSNSPLNSFQTVNNVSNNNMPNTFSESYSVPNEATDFSVNQPEKAVNSVDNFGEINHPSTNSYSDPIKQQSNFNSSKPGVVKKIVITLIIVIIVIIGGVIAINALKNGFAPENKIQLTDSISIGNNILLSDGSMFFSGDVNYSVNSCGTLYSVRDKRENKIYIYDSNLNRITKYDGYAVVEFTSDSNYTSCVLIDSGNKRAIILDENLNEIYKLENIDTNEIGKKSGISGAYSTERGWSGILDYEEFGNVPVPFLVINDRVNDKLEIYRKGKKIYEETSEIPHDSSFFLVKGNVLQFYDRFEIYNDDSEVIATIPFSDYSVGGITVGPGEIEEISGGYITVRDYLNGRVVYNSKGEIVSPPNGFSKIEGSTVSLAKNHFVVYSHNGTDKDKSINDTNYNINVYANDKLIKTFDYNYSVSPTDAGFVFSEKGATSKQFYDSEWNLVYDNVASCSSYLGLLYFTFTDGSSKIVTKDLKVLKESSTELQYKLILDFGYLFYDDNSVTIYYENGKKSYEIKDTQFITDITNAYNSGSFVYIDNYGNRLLFEIDNKEIYFVNMENGFVGKYSSNLKVNKNSSIFSEGSNYYNAEGNLIYTKN